MIAERTISRFFLYGEAPRDVELDFLHLESIRTRSLLHDWTIRPHAHPDLHQCVVVTKGGGGMVAEAVRWDFRAPALITIPPIAVHGFDFERESDGVVVTVASSFLAEAIHSVPDLIAAAAGVQCHNLDAAGLE